MPGGRSVDDREVVESFWSAMIANDWERAAAHLADECVVDWPCSGERIARRHFAEIQARYPAAAKWRFDVHRLIAEGDVAVERGLSTDQLGGPIAIARASGSAAAAGFAQLLQLTAFLSINVAIFNLLPIPILDGGQILINLLQAVKGSPFSLRSREYMMRFGLAMIALIFALAMFNDLRRVAGDLARWIR